MGTASSKKSEHTIEITMEDPFSVYVPLESLTESTIRSIISVATSSESPNWDYSERTLLIFLLAINKKLTEIENNKDEYSIEQATKVRQWLVNDRNEPLDWDKLQNQYNKIAKQNCTELARYYGSKDAHPYFELTVDTVSYLYY